MVRNRKNVENDTLYELNHGEKTLKRWKIRNAHFRAWSMARKLKIMENEKQII